MLALGPGAPRAPTVPIRSPELDPRKTKPAASTNIVLGVVADLSPITTPEPHVLFRPDPDRVVAVLATFRRAYERRFLSPQEAASLRGKLLFTATAAYGMVGRAATLPLVHRQYRDRVYGFYPGSDLHHSLLFYEAILPRLPPLRVPIAPDTTRPLLVYSDASFSRVRVPVSSSPACTALRRRLRGGLGVVIYDPVDGSVRVASGTPPWDILFASWSTDKKTYIAELEALAALAAYSTYPTLFAGRRVHHFIDNTVALSAMVHGYAGKPELAKAVNVFHLQNAGLRTSVYLDWVPSKANIADLPSRDAFAELAIELEGLPISGSFPDALVVPDLASWHAPLETWILRSPSTHGSHPL